MSVAADRLQEIKVHFEAFNSAKNLTSCFSPKLSALHPKINPKDILENGKLLQDSKIQKLLAFKKSNSKAIKLKKKDSNFKFYLHESSSNHEATRSILFIDQDIYAIYRDLSKPSFDGYLGPKGNTTQGYVKLAQNLITGEWVAIKVIDKTVACYEEEEVTNEIKCLKELGQLKGYAATKEKVYIAETLFSGTTVSNRLHHSAFIKESQENPNNSIVIILNICINLMKTMESLHKKGIVHGDFHANNIMVEPITDKLNVIDFGHSSLIAELQGTRNYEIAYDNRNCLELVLQLLESPLSSVIKNIFVRQAIAKNEIILNAILKIELMLRSKNANLSNLSASIKILQDAYLTWAKKGVGVLTLEAMVNEEEIKIMKEQNSILQFMKMQKKMNYSDFTQVVFKAYVASLHNLLHDDKKTAMEALENLIKSETAQKIKKIANNSVSQAELECILKEHTFKIDLRKTIYAYPSFHLPQKEKTGGLYDVAEIVSSFLTIQYCQNSLDKSADSDVVMNTAKC